MFCSDAWTSYPPVHGELLAITWAMKMMKHWTLVCDNLVICVNHTPMFGFLTMRPLTEIDNIRLRILVGKSMRWRFHIVNIPCIKNKYPDALSWFPSGGEAKV